MWFAASFCHFDPAAIDLLTYTARAYLVHESYGGALEGVLLGQVDAHLPYAPLVRRALRTEELHHELVQAAEDGHLVVVMVEDYCYDVNTKYTPIRQSQVYPSSSKFINCTQDKTRIKTPSLGLQY